MPEEPKSPATVASAEPTPVALRDYYEGRTPLKQLFGSATPPPADAQDQTQANALLADLGGCDPDLRKTIKLASRTSQPAALAPGLGPDDCRTRAGRRPRPGRVLQRLWTAPPL